MRACLAFLRKTTGRIWGKREGNFTLRRFLIIYLAFCLLVFCLLAPVYFYTERTVHQVELDRCHTQLESGKALLENAVNSLYDLSVSTCADSRFRALLRNSEEGRLDVLTMKELQQIFAGMLVHTSLFDEIGLLIRDDVAFTRERLFYSNPYYSFYPDYLQCGQNTFEEWVALLRQHQGTFVPAMQYTTAEVKNFQAITFSLRWPTDYNNSGCYIYAVIRVDQLMALMADSDVLTQGQVLLLDGQGNILAQTENFAGDDACSVLTASLAAGRGTLMVKVPERVLGERLLSVNRLILIYVICVVAVAIAAVLFFAYHSAKPMRTLLSVFESMDQEETPPPEDKIPRLQKDYQFLARNIRDMGNQLAIYRRTLETQRHILCASIWERTLMHGIHSPGEREQFVSAFPEFPAAWRLAVVRYAGQDILSIEESAVMQVKLCALLSQCASGAIAENVQSGVAAVLLPGDYDVNMEEWEQRFASDVHGLQVIACALSDAYSQPEELHAAYQQALDLVFLPGDMPFVRQMKDMPGESLRVPLSILDAEMLYNALRGGSLSVAVHILDNCLQELRADEDNVMLWRFVYNQVANAVARLRLENPSRLLHMIIPRYEHAEREKLFEEDLPACFRLICDSQGVQNENEAQRIEKIVQYIDDHLMDSQLGVAALVNEFKVSAPTLQKMIRMKTNMTLAAYVDERRLALAVRMLTESPLSISEISTRCGYGSVNSFYKAFKRRHGVAPSAMQRMNKEENPEDNA